MNGFFGYLDSTGVDDAESGLHLAAMCEAQRLDSRMPVHAWSSNGLNIGVLDNSAEPLVPHCSPDGRFIVWAVGRIYSGLADVHRPCRASEPDALAALARLATENIDRLSGLDGEYQIVCWNPRTRELILTIDWFGCLPLYWSNAGRTIAFASTTAAVVAAPHVPATPDPDAIREAITFGGARLGDRTNILGVHMLGGGHALTWTDGVLSVRRVKPWPAAENVRANRRIVDLAAEAHEHWQRAVGERMAGSKRPGNTLSGGLDSRAVLAEGIGSTSAWTSVSYGVPRCDDVRFAEMAAKRAGARWIFYPLYSRSSPDWLERRSSWVLATSGLLPLSDLLHLESADIQAEAFDEHICGYVGDVVCGPTYGGVVDGATLLHAMPYSGVPIGMPYDEAMRWARHAIEQVAPASPRFAVFDHKFPQTIHQIFQATQSRIETRRPFLDHRLFEFFSRFDTSTRSRVYQTMLRNHYPRLFARIPHQQTNWPVLTPDAVVRAGRIARYASRRLTALLARFSLAQPPRSRGYHLDDVVWRSQPVRERLVAAITRRGSVSVEVFGARPLAGMLEDWFDRGRGPVQSVGALYTYEVYFDRLPALLRSARGSRPLSPKPVQCAP